MYDNNQSEENWDETEEDDEEELNEKYSFKITTKPDKISEHRYGKY